MDIHPLFVHFPVVCIILAALFDWLALSGRCSGLQSTGLGLIVIGALTAIPAAYTGESAAEAAQLIPSINDALERHENLSTFTLWSALILAVARIHLTARDLYTGSRRMIHTVLVTGCAILVTWTAYTGGMLVYEYGAGTKSAKQSVMEQ